VSASRAGHAVRFPFTLFASGVAACVHNLQAQGN